MIPHGYEEINVADPAFDAALEEGRIDELCRCGRLQSEHEPTIWSGMPVADGHGACPASGCIKFTWTMFVRRVD